jgi:hypothetical protein
MSIPWLPMSYEIIYNVPTIRQFSKLSLTKNLNVSEDKEKYSMATARVACRENNIIRIRAS